MADNLALVREKIGSAPVRLIAVTKNVEVDAIEEAVRLGVTEFGENRVQDALEKQARISPEVSNQVRWHLIGHLQTNKVRKAVGRFALIHSIDSLRLAEEVSREAQRKGTVQAVLLQVKILPDPSKSGFSPEELHRHLPAILRLAGLKVEGLMTISPLSDDPDVWHCCFEGLRTLRDSLQQIHGVSFQELSMGMTQDYLEAVNCGATMVRLGRAIFGS